MSRFPLYAAVFTALLVAPAHAEIVRNKTAHSVKETIDRLEAAIKQRGLAVVVRVDHSAAAKKAGLELRPTELIVFGSAAVGTPLMQAEQTMGLSLPMKALAWEDSRGQVCSAVTNRKPSRPNAACLRAILCFRKSATRSKR